ncbi:unnamed protein product [Nippostrongylus brasiliensis]|uniref:Uncharacterized protein n=1 Tax=Nippostrongylus brasiliensis TaxID=27835 RepID=A0A0N4Y1Q8_NIPBR|nr:unnamed protein product [Nippostrongylus brasiliensis]
MAEQLLTVAAADGLMHPDIVGEAQIATRVPNNNQRGPLQGHQPRQPSRAEQFRGIQCFNGGLGHLASRPVSADRVTKTHICCGCRGLKDTLPQTYTQPTPTCRIRGDLFITDP